jgi:hypothetical protein
MKTVSRRLTGVFVAIVMLLANVPTQTPLNALNKTSAADLSVLGDTSSPSVIPSPDRTRVSTALQSSPVMFIENVGQFAPSTSPTGTGQAGTRFQVRGGDRTIWLAEDAIWVTVLEQGGKETSRQVDKEALPIHNPRSEIENQKGVNLKLSFVGANPHPRLEPFNRLDTRVSYFIGNDPDKWRPDVPTWGGVRYVDLYPGIDLEIASENGQTTQRIVAHSNANPSVVRLQVEGADALTLDGNRLRLTTAVGEFSLPLLQVTDATLACPTLSGNQVAMPFASPIPNLQSISNTQSLIPNSESGASDLLYSTFLGGSYDDYGNTIAVDGSGAAYITGWTNSSDFPTTPGAFGMTYNGGYSDAFVVKLNAAGSTLAYATFLGGSCYDFGYAIAVDESGVAYVTGLTGSYDFPTTPGTFDTGYNGGANDAFVVKLNAAGSTLAYATFLGGSSSDEGHAIAVDGSGAAYITGWTYSSDFPTTPSAFDTTFSGGDAFVVKLNAAGSTLAYATFLGGSNDELGDGIAVDGSGAAYVTGYTYSSDFPTTPGAFDTTHNGNHDAFMAKLNAAGSALAYATFLGGSSSDDGHAIAVDGAGAAYVTGYTYSSDFPTTPGAFDTTYNGNYDAFVVKLNAAGSALAYATFLGGE